MYQQIRKIAKRVNERVDIKAVPEFIEGMFLRGAVRSVDNIIQQKLPDEIYSMINDSVDGVNREEADKIKEELNKAIDKRTDELPIFVDAIADTFVPVVVDEIIYYVNKGVDIVND